MILFDSACVLHILTSQIFESQYQIRKSSNTSQKQREKLWREHRQYLSYKSFTHKRDCFVFTFQSFWARLPWQRASKKWWESWWQWARGHMRLWWLQCEKHCDRYEAQSEHDFGIDYNRCRDYDHHRSDYKDHHSNYSVTGNDYQNILQIPQRKNATKKKDLSRTVQSRNRLVWDLNSLCLHESARPHVPMSACVSWFED